MSIGQLRKMTVVLTSGRDIAAQCDITTASRSRPLPRREGMHNSNDLQHRSAITVERLTKTWPGGVEAVKGVDFTVAPGEVFGLLGPNGAGKSTTVGMLTTTARPTAGRAALLGHDVATDPRAARAVSGVVFQDAVVDKVL